MDNYKEVLEYLIELKKTKKEPNRIERDQFTEAWQCLVAAEGYSDDADAYLYNGFTYCGATVIKHFVKASDNPVEAVRKVFSGKMYGKNCASTVPILFHLLTLLLNEKKPELLLISEVIKRIPSALKNKEGKIYGQADRALKKYVLDDLHSEELPSFEMLVDSGLKTAFVKEFISSIDEIMSGMKSDGFSKKCLRNIKLMNEWTHPIQGESVATEEQNTSTAEVTGDVQNDDASAESIQSVETEKTTDQNDESSLSTCEAKIRELSESLAVATKEAEQQKKIVVQLRKQISDLEAEKNKLTEMASLRETKIFTLTGELTSAKQTVEHLKLQIEQLERELQERMMMVEALSRDRAKQSDEAFNRLASKLRVEYRDFVDAVDIPMDSDLGENMREQLKNVFNILIKAGIAIN